MLYYGLGNGSKKHAWTTTPDRFDSFLDCLMDSSRVRLILVDSFQFGLVFSS